MTSSPEEIKNTASQGKKEKRVGPKGSYGLEERDPVGKFIISIPLPKVNLEGGNPLENSPKPTSPVQERSNNSKTGKGKEKISSPGHLRPGREVPHGKINQTNPSPKSETRMGDTLENYPKPTSPVQEGSNNRNTGN